MTEDQGKMMLDEFAVAAAMNLGPDPFYLFTYAAQRGIAPKNIGDLHRIMLPMRDGMSKARFNKALAAMLIGMEEHYFDFFASCGLKASDAGDAVADIGFPEKPAAYWRKLAARMARELKRDVAELSAFCDSQVESDGQIVGFRE